MKVVVCEDTDWLLSEEAFSIYASCMYHSTYEDYKTLMETVLPDIVQLLRTQAATLVKPQVFLRYVRIKNQNVVRIDCDINATPVKLCNGVRLQIFNPAEKIIA